MSTYDGKPHPRCGKTLRYIANGKCVACVLADGAARHAARIERGGNGHAGLKDGYVRFGTLAHRVLQYVHEAGPSLHAEMIDAMPGEVGLSVNLGRLVRHGFLHRGGRQSYKPGVRSGRLFSIDKPHWRTSSAPPATPAMRRATYLRALKLRVSSVFDYRGGMTL